MTKFLNISVDNTLGGASPSDEVVSSQKAIKEYVDAHGGSVSIDNNSITQNSSDELQTVGVIDQNATTTAIKTWTGTKSQYDALVSGGTVDNNTLYHITDDVTLSVPILETIYPVGSIYITTNATCPLNNLIGTWELVSSGRVLQGADANHSAGSTAEAGLPNITGTKNDVGMSNNDSQSGALYRSNVVANSGYLYDGTGAYYERAAISFDASRSNSIYGKSSTVQPPAYFVNIFRRTA